MRRIVVLFALFHVTVACSKTERNYANEAGSGGTAGTAGDSAGGDDGRGGSSGTSKSSTGTAGKTSAQGGSSTHTSATGGVGALGTVCVANDVKCGGAEVETTVLKCGAAQTEYTATAYCSDSSSQCNPSTGTCFKLGIDTLEVTRDQYSAFLASTTKPSQVGICSTINSTFTPDASCTALATVCNGSSCANHPQVCVDWCDAYAYCDSIGKRLCGRIGGGMNPFDRFADPGSSEWMNACSAGGQYEYGSGATVQSGAQFCNYLGTQLGTTAAVGSRIRCASPSPTYQTFFDLSGNAAEWENSCERELDALDATAADACRTRGGSFATALAALACDTVPATALRRDSVSPDVGFRCCAK